LEQGKIKDMRTRNWFILTGLVFLGMGILILRPVPIPEEKDCLSLTGTVEEVYKAGSKDVVFTLQGLDKTFYINRGLERGIDLKKLRADLSNKEIVILYPKYWTPLDPANSFRHISKIKCEGRTIFTEID
jgi:hypothetical protein